MKMMMINEDLRDSQESAIKFYQPFLVVVGGR